MSLTYRERPASGEAEGLLILHHGRGADEHDLLGLGDTLDPERRLHVVTPRAPLTLGNWPGYHWYVVPRVGYPDHETFHAAYRALSEFHDDVWERTGIAPERTIFGGFSMGSVMSYSLGLGADRPAPAGILAFSGFIPVVDDWQPELTRRPEVFIAHGRQDPVMEVGFARRAKALLVEGGLDVEYHESDAAHHIDPAHVPAAIDWVGRTLVGTGARSPLTWAVRLMWCSRQCLGPPATSVACLWHVSVVGGARCGGCAAAGVPYGHRAQDREDLPMCHDAAGSSVVA